MKIQLLKSFCIYCMLVRVVLFKKNTLACTPAFWLYVHEQRETSGSLFQADSIAKWGNAVLLNLHPDEGGLETMVLAEV